MIQFMNMLAILLGIFLVPQAQSGTIEGIVLRGGTSQPISNAVVELSINDKSEALWVSTGGDGKFEFRNLAPGRYRLTASRNGYLDTAYGQRGPNGTGSSLSVEAGQALKDIRLTMIATGAISGRVTDSNGQPLTNIPVQALKYSYKDGEQTLTLVRADSTDDRGEYRLFWLPPGTYYVSAASARPGIADFSFITTRPSGETMKLTADGLDLKGNRTTAEKLGEMDAPFYFPGTADTRRATPMELKPGAEVGGIDFSLTRVRTVNVRGIAIDATTGQPVSAANIMLHPRHPSVAGSQRGVPASNGTFQIERILPGSYYLAAEKRIETPGKPDKVIGGRVPIEVGTEDLDRVAIVLSAGVTLEGLISIEGRYDVGAGNFQPIVSIKNKFSGMPAWAELWAGFKDGNKEFTIDDVISGDYRFTLYQLPKGAYLKSVRLGASEMRNGIISIDTRSNSRLEIVLSMNGGKLEGTVSNRNRELLANTTVVLVPDASRRERDDLFRSVTSDESGKFLLDAIAPGEYSLFAWEDIEESLWRDPAFIRRNEASGKPIRILENSAENIELTAIPFVF